MKYNFHPVALTEYSEAVQFNVGIPIEFQGNKVQCLCNLYHLYFQERL